MIPGAPHVAGAGRAGAVLLPRRADPAGGRLAAARGGDAHGGLRDERRPQRRPGAHAVHAAAAGRARRPPRAHAHLRQEPLTGTNRYFTPNYTALVASPWTMVRRC